MLNFVFMLGGCVRDEEMMRMVSRRTTVEIYVDWKLSRSKDELLHIPPFSPSHHLINSLMFLPEQQQQQ